MENREGTLMWVGALAIACLGYFYKQKREERLEYLANKNILQKKCREIIDNGRKIDFERIKESGKKEHVFFPQVREYNIEKDTYTRFVRHQKKMDYFGRELGTIREGQTGGRFCFKDPINNQEVVAEINDCKIEQFVLSEKREENIVFQQNKNKIAQSCNLTYRIKGGQRLALFGLIGYSITEQKFIFEPDFILGGRESSEGILQKLTYFWQQKIQKVALHKMLLGFSILAISYIFIYHPIKSIWNRHRSKFEDISKQKLKHFYDKAQFSAKTSSNLTCQICKNNSVNIIYECGHLCVCQTCNVDNKDQRCPICNKVSTKSIKIFL